MLNNVTNIKLIVHIVKYRLEKCYWAICEGWMIIAPIYKYWNAIIYWILIICINAVNNPRFKETITQEFVIFLFIRIIIHHFLSKLVNTIKQWFILFKPNE